MAAELRTVPAVTFICRPCLRHLSRHSSPDTAADTDDTLADGDGDDDDDDGDDDDKERGHGDTQHCHCHPISYTH